MSKAHPLAGQIKQWADNPNGWQWQIFGAAPFVTKQQEWIDASVDVAISCNPEIVRLIPKRSLIPADCLPEGWEVEREDGTYIVRRPGLNTTTWTHRENIVHQLLRHIDPEASDE